MKIVSKYLIEPGSSMMIMLPKTAKVLCLEPLRSIPCVWVLVPDPELEVPLCERWFHVATADEPLPERIGEYIGSFQRQGDVFHLFDLPGGPDA